MDNQENPAPADLQRKADMLKATDLFTGEKDAKQGILLVLAGEKPVASATSGHWQETDDGRTRVADDPAEVTAFLDGLGVAYRLNTDQFGTDATIARDAKTLEEFEQATQADDHAAIGRLFGYPDSAVKAFVDHDLLGDEDAEKLLAEAGLSQPSFGLSAKHFHEELAFLKHQESLLAQYGLN